MTSADRTYPKNIMMCWKKWHFFGLIFKLKSFSLWNTISIQSNISLTLAAKMHISSRYLKRWQTDGSLNTSPSCDKIWLLNLPSQRASRASLWTHTSLTIQLRMLSYECLPLPLAFANTLVPNQMTKTIGRYAQPTMPHLYGVKGRHPLPQ